MYSIVIIVIFNGFQANLIGGQQLVWSDAKEPEIKVHTQNKNIVFTVILDTYNLFITNQIPAIKKINSKVNT